MIIEFMSHGSVWQVWRDCSPSKSKIVDQKRIDKIVKVCFRLGIAVRQVPKLSLTNRERETELRWLDNVVP